MKNLLRIAACVLIICSLQSCFSAKIESSKQAGYNEKLYKVYIIVNGAKETKNFSQTFFTGLKAKLREKNIQSNGFLRDPLSLDTEEDVLKKINDYDPQALLVIKQTHITYTNGTVTDAKLDLTLIDGKTQKPVWKGLAKVYGAFGITESAEVAVNNVIKKLQEDKLI